MTDLPTGRVTFLFTDIEGSTRLVQQLGAGEYRRLLGEHSTILRAAVGDHDGREFGTEGDAHFFVFREASGAVRAAIEAQRALAARPWPPDAEVRVRMGIHTGTPEVNGADYVGVDLNRVARIAAAGHGEQVLLSAVTTEAIDPALAQQVRLTDLGLHRLKDLVESEHLVQLSAPGLREDFPAIRTIDTRPKQLPAQLTSFIGRGRELGEIADLLGRSRLVTLTGPGGTGKTRLAVAVADRLLPRFSDGVFFVPVAPIDDPERVPAAIATVLGLREAPEQPVVQVLEEHLRDKSMLLVIDNLEHLAAAAPIIAKLLERAPAVSALTTSRELLHVYGEQGYPVQPLPVPPSGGPAEPMATNPCVVLFLERATAVRPDFRLTEQSLSIVAEICRRVDGLPLAVELAAARVRILPLVEIVARLDRRLAALTGGARDLPERQQTLRATIDWSHDLLDSAERRLFARLSVFAGGWTRQAAETICAGDLGIDVLDGLASLVDKSLVRRETARDDDVRFDLLQTIQEYARERLEDSGEADRVRRLHAEHFRDLAEAAEPNLTGPDSERWLETLGIEVPNIRGALRWAIDSGHPGDLEAGLLTAGALWRFWQLTGALREGADWNARLLARADPGSPSAGRAKALRGAGGIVYWQNDLPRSRQLYEESVAIYRALGDRAGTAAALNDLAYLPMLMGELELARSFFTEARDLFQAQGDAWQATLAELNIGQVDFFARRYDEALRSWETALPMIRERGDRFWLTEAITGLGYLDQLTGRFDSARGHYAEALEIALDAGTEPQVAMVLEPLSNLDAAERDFPRAVRLWAAAQAIKERVGGGAPSEMMQTVDPRPAAAEAIGEQAVAEAWATGHAMTPAEAVAFATEGVQRSTTAGRAAPASDRG
ncbi:MAG TPA: tetratricopeptide repeat protein [Candidatus Limnocylindria bacterium]|nr:tetratricopeptide repeat protein [Candidatus Limnocylindria bacterium]